MMNQELSSFTAKLDALREKGFSDDEINAILSGPAPQAQPSAQADMSNPESVGVYQFLKSPPSSMPVTEDMTESDRAYAKEWNEHVDVLSLFYGWKADAIGFFVILLGAWPILHPVSDDIRTSGTFAFGWMAAWFVFVFLAMVYIKQKFFLPRIKFFLKKRLS